MTAALPFSMSVAFLMLEPGARLELTDELANFGFQAREFDAVSELDGAADESALNFCVVDASGKPEQALAAIARIRAASSAGIVLLTGPQQVETRIHGLLIGADAYLTLPVQGRELAAVMLGIARRLRIVKPEPTLAPGAVPPARFRLAWELQEEGSVLVSPDGLRLELSQAERTLIFILAERAGEVASREMIGRLLDQSGSRGSDASAEPRGPQRVSMLVSRLRRKAARLGVMLPLRVVRGCGYAFTEQIEYRNLQGDVSPLPYFL